MYKPFYAAVCFLTSIAICAAAPVVIDGTATVKMEIKNPIPAEQTAKDELNTYIKRIFAAYPGKSSARAQFILRHDPALDEQEFKIKCADGKVIISGGRPQGLLYGAYWFIDRKLGVHLYDAHAEYCPSKPLIEVKEFEKYGKPAIADRMYLFTNNMLPAYKGDEAGIRWATFNLLSGNRPVEKNNLNAKYGERPAWAPPLGSHGMLGLINANLYKDRPEFFALQEGKRIDPVSRGVTVDYCLTNEELIKETAKRCLHYLKTCPDARYISISEGDGNRGMCACEPCQKLVKAHGKRESARWVYFANRVARIVKKDYPKVKLAIFAYIASQKPPVNMQVDDNVAVQIVMLGVRRGRPYNDPQNKKAVRFLQEVVEPWRKICKNVMIWDYVWQGNRLMVFPDQLLNLHNTKYFASIGITALFPEDNVMGLNLVDQGRPFRPWLLARAMWDPEDCGDGEALETMFCNEYFGPAAGPYVKQFYKYLRDVHWKSGFVGMTSGGTLTRAPYEAPEVTAKGYKIMCQAYEAALKEQNREHIRRVYEAMLPVKFLLASDYSKVKPFLHDKKTGKEHIQDIRNYLRGKSKNKIIWTNYKKLHRILNATEGIANINADASREYGAYKAANAYDGNLKTNWTPGLGVGWTMIDLGENRFINRITTVFHSIRHARRVTYQVEGSFDKKAWRIMIPKKVFTVPEKIQQAKDVSKTYCVDDVTLEKDVEARYIRTRIFKSETRTGTGGYKPNDCQHMEQYFNLKEIPDVLKNSFVKE